MAVTPTNTNKNSASVTNRGKTGKSVTWEEAVYTWGESEPSTWDTARKPIARRSKNSASVSNRSKT